jgi:hypothetical protein
LTAEPSRLLWYGEVRVFGDNLLAIVIVLFCVFLTMAAIVSVVQEVIGQLWNVRSKTLRGCISGMLTDNASYGKTIVDRFFRHPRIVTPGRRPTSLTRINPEDFAVAFASAIQPETGPGDSLTHLSESIRSLREGSLKSRLRLALPEVFNPDVTAEQVKKSLEAWFNAQMNKASEGFRSHTRVRLYVTAAIITVLFNVSAIKIVQGLRDQPELAKAFSSAAPEIARLVMDTSQNTIATLATNERAVASNANLNLYEGDASEKLPITLSSGEQAEGFTKGDARAMLLFYECRKNLMVLPVGWPWMAGLVDHLAVRATAVTDKVANIEADPSETPAERQARSCASALSQTGFSPGAAEQLRLLGFERADTTVQPSATQQPASPPPAEAPAAPAVTLPQSAAPSPAAVLEAPPIEEEVANVEVAAEQVRFVVRPSEFMPQFGPNFRTDPWYAILLGWIITTFAAAQGAPFWFDLLKKLVARRP